MAYIGKNIIENLTTAMYNNSRIVYREYIQNSADGIDKAVSAILKADFYDDGFEYKVTNEEESYDLNMVAEEGEEYKHE